MVQNRTLAAADTPTAADSSGHILYGDTPAGTAVTLSDDATGVWVDGDAMVFHAEVGRGNITVTPASGVTINGLTDPFVVREGHEVGFQKDKTTDSWATQGGDLGFRNVAHTAALAAADLAGLTFLAVDWTGSSWTNAAGGALTLGDTIIGAKRTKTAITYGSDTLDVVATVLDVADSAGIDDYKVTGPAPIGDNRMGLFSSAGNLGFRFDLDASASASSAFSTVEVAMAVRIDVYETGTTTPYKVNAYQVFTDQRDEGNIRYRCYFSNNRAGISIADTTTIERTAMASFIDGFFTAESFVGDNFGYAGIANAQTDDEAVGAIMIDQSSWVVVCSVTDDSAGASLLNRNVVLTTTKPVGLDEDLIDNPPSRTFYRYTDIFGNVEWRDAAGELVAAPTSPVDGEAPTLIPFHWGVAVYTDNPPYVMTYPIPFPAVIRYVTQGWPVSATADDALDFAITVDGFEVHTSVGAASLANAGVEVIDPDLDYRIPAGGTLSMAPKTTPIPGAPPVGGVITAWIERL